jgi:hypothetical protein
MISDALLQSVWVRIVLAIFFILSGALTTLGLLLASPSFWYLPCAALWTLFGFVWLIRPSLAAGLSSFPVLGIAIMSVQTLPNIRQTDTGYKLLLLSVAIALVLIGVTLRKRTARKIVPVAVSFSLVVVAFLVDREFTGKVAIHSYSMNWSANGMAPWGRVESDEKGEFPVVIYQSVNGGYCYDAVFSPELKARLTAFNRPTVTVEYNVFSDFGHERGYNIHAIDGLIFNLGYRPVRPSDGYGGYVMNPYSSGDCQR